MVEVYRLSAVIEQLFWISPLSCGANSLLFNYLIQFTQNDLGPITPEDSHSPKPVLSSKQASAIGNVRCQLFGLSETVETRTGN